MGVNLLNMACCVSREWMEGAWGTMDPDKVDGETGNFWRALYKLEKQFGDVPNAQKIAARVNLVDVAQYVFI